MGFYSERHGMRKPIEKTYEIDPGKYGVLLRCCEEYYDNIAWKYPDKCEDDRGYFGLDKWKLAEEMRYEIPTLFFSDSGEVAIPRVVRNIFETEPKVDEYDQSALLDFIEYIFANMRDIQKGDYHKFYTHYHLITKATTTIRAQFRTKINACFEKTGLLYTLNSNGEVDRVLVNDIESNAVESIVVAIKEKGTRELLQEAVILHRSHDPNSARDATEKIWDAFERLKTYYKNLNKSDSANRIISEMSNGSEDYIALFTEEFKKLTKVGNDFRIRHHETDKIEISDIRYYDYFYNRCLSLIALAVQYLK